MSEKCQIKNGSEATRGHSGMPAIRNASAYNWISLGRRKCHLFITVEMRWVGSICRATTQACRGPRWRLALALNRGSLSNADLPCVLPSNHLESI